ncbi:MAG: GTPase HflX [Oligoflexia bacterium]|nr:GTPase HflX [Oligoflexia bacterium]
MLDLTPRPERAILVGVAVKSDDPRLMEQSLDELAHLTETAGAVVVGVTSQRLERIVPATFIGSGKIQEVARLKDETQASTIILDTRLSGVQSRNLQELIGAKVIDRTQLILDIFASRAQTREGKLQVELALLRDQLPRLIGEALAGLSKQAGGIGTRGPGETKLEMDRRRIYTRISHLEKELDSVRKTRDQHRKRRHSSRVPIVALAGYTNSGKSTLLNRLTKSHVLSEDKLFATLDPTTRKIRLPSGRPAVLTDTVGFINNLPHTLVEAFKATFEEISESDLIIHVHDAANPFESLHTKVVTDLLKDIQAHEKPIIHAYNKIDLVTDLSERTAQRIVPFVNISATTGKGLDSLLELIGQSLVTMTQTVELYLPSNDPSLVYKLARDGKILKQEAGAHVIKCQVQISEEALQRWSQYIG